MTNMDLFGFQTRYSKGKCKSAKTCSKCGKTKPLWAFSRDSRQKDGLRSTCKECDADAQRESRRKIDYINIEYKQCSDCGIVKPIDDFGIDKTKKDKHRSYCLSCMRERAKRTKPNAKTGLRRRKF